MWLLGSSQKKKAPQNLGGISKIKLDYKRVIVSTAVRVVPSPTAVMVTVRVHRAHSKTTQKKPPRIWGASQKPNLTINVSS